MKAKTETKAKIVLDLWPTGMPVADIAKRLGLSAAVTGALIHKLRARGYDLPYRKRV